MAIVFNILMQMRLFRNTLHPLSAFAAAGTVTSSAALAELGAVMPHESWDRRKFNELSAAAIGGLVAGSLAGCGDPPKGNKAPTAPGKVTAGEKHLCRGLNDCKGQGAGGKNDCRGQGDCATVEHHTCGGKNDCKGLGGCGASAGMNDCKGKGGCHVPLMDSAWDKIRKSKEEAWSKASEKFSDAPAKKEQETPAEE